MNNFTHPVLRPWLRLSLKVIICTLWLLCIVSAALAAPGIAQQPVNVTACSGTNPTFTIGGVTGTTGTVTIKWQESINGGPFAYITDGGSYSGATTITLTLTNVTVGSHNGRSYRCEVKDDAGTTTSNAAVLTVNQTPAVVTTPKSTFICVDAKNNPISVLAVSGATYQWQVSTNNGGAWANVLPADGYLGSTTNTLIYPTIKISMNGNLYRYRITVNGCSNTSVAVDTLHVALKPAWVAPLPGDAFTEICPGDDVTFADSATGVPPIVYKWQIQPFGGAYTDIVDNAVFSGSQGKILRITHFPGVEGSINFIRLKATYPAPYLTCDVNTGAVQMTVRTLPAVNIPPAAVTTCANTDTAFSVEGSGSLQLHYQWQTDNGTNGLSWTNVGTDDERLSVNAVTTAMNGWNYRVTIGNDCTPPATSNAATLTVRRSGTWLGAKDTAWQEPMNWCGGVPDNTIDVLVPNWPTKMPLISDGTGTAFYKSLEIEDAARLTISGGTISNMTGPFTLAGTVAYIATRDQEIFPANHGSLEINGTGNKYLRSNVNISHNLVLGGSAKLATRSNFLTMKNGSNTIATSGFTGAATSWVVTGDGSTGAGHTGIGGLRIEQIDATDGVVVFPIGPTPAAYNPLRLSNAGAIDDFTIAVNDQRIPGSVINTSVNRTWSVSEAVAGGSNVTLSLRWQSGEEQTDFYRAHAMIIRSNGTSIVQKTSEAAAAGANPYTSADGVFTALTLFSVASTASVLPMELTSFTAQKTGTAAVGLAWNTTGVLESKYFNVQRSTDGVNFTTIGKVEGETGKTAYNYTDNLPGSGMVCYRLQITTQQNEVVYTGIQSVLLNSVGLAQLRPSVTNGAVTNLYVYTSEQSRISLCITDVSGRVHGSQSLKLNKGVNQMPIWIGALTKGVYYVNVKDGNGNASVLKLVKQ